LRCCGLDLTIIFTGQHELAPADFGLSEFECRFLRCPGQPDPQEHVAQLVRALKAPFDGAPDLVVVQGDTSSALAGAIAAFRAGIAVAHVEAGLRTHDRLPWPEEQFRTSIDAGAALLFAPTRLAAANLRAERVSGEIHVTGNTAVDATREAMRQLPAPPLRDGGQFRMLVTCHRRESWNEGMGSIAQALSELAAQAIVSIDVVLHPNPFVAERMQRLLGRVRSVRLLAPCSHSELLSRMQNADLVLSDSGGIQEETPTLGVPLLILRDKTERPEGVAAGVSRLVGTSPGRIVSEVRSLIDNPAELAKMSRPCAPYGDGRAAEHISRIISRWLAERRLTQRTA
jgi:UDP-N-acetylglucosamine 2-epimerase (non-hydrolysing)